MKLSLALQEALLTRLRAEDALTSALGGPNVFDSPPHAASTDAALPNIVLGDERIEAWNTQDSRGDEHLVSLSIWSAARGYLEIKTLMKLVHDALEAQALPLAGGRLVTLRFASAETGRAARGRLRRATCRFRALVEHDPPD